MEISDHVADSDLLRLLGSRFWLARAGAVALSSPDTLRKALCHAHLFAAEGGSSITIVRVPNENVRLGSAQIKRLFERIGLN